MFKTRLPRRIGAFRGFGITAAEVESPSLYTYDAPILISTPAAESGGGFLPVLQSLISSAGTVGGEFLKLQSMKTQVQALKTQSVLATKYPYLTTQPQAASLLPTGGTGTLLMIGALGIGAFLLLRGKGVKGRRSRRR